MNLPVSISNDDDNGKQGMSASKRKIWYMQLLKIVLAIGMWYGFSIIATVINKVLISDKGSVNALTLTFFHVLTSSVCDIVNMSVFHRHELRYYMNHISVKEAVRCIYPLGIAMMLAKFLTYKSYGKIPVSLTHTVKALQPFFNVLVVFIWTGGLVDLPTFLSLIPIIVGVAYASSKEIEFELVGFIYAMLSTVIGVWQGVYLKMLMRTGLQKNFIHLCNATFSTVILLPIVVFLEVYNSTYMRIDFKRIFLSAFIQYMSSISSYSAMYLLSSLSYSIASTFKRVSIIISTSIIFHKQLSIGNLAGIAIASFGAIAYNIATKRSKRERKLPELKKDAKFSFIDSITVK